MSERFSLCLVSVVSDKKKKKGKKMDYSFKMGLLGEMSHISLKHIYLVQVKKCTHLYILGIFIRRSDVAPGKYYG